MDYSAVQLWMIRKTAVSMRTVEILNNHLKCFHMNMTHYMAKSYKSTPKHWETWKEYEFSCICNRKSKFQQQLSTYKISIHGTSTNIWTVLFSENYIDSSGLVQRWFIVHTIASVDRQRLCWRLQQQQQVSLCSKDILTFSNNLHLSCLDKSLK